MTGCGMAIVDHTEKHGCSRVVAQLIQQNDCPLKFGTLDSYPYTKLAPDE